MDVPADRQVTSSPLASVLVQVTRRTLVADGLDAALAAVATGATELEPGCNWAAVGLTGRRWYRHAASGAVAVSFLELQRAVGDGPLLADLPVGGTLGSGDLVADQRWPRLAARVGELPVRSVASFAFRFRRGAVGRLTCCGEQFMAFDAAKRKDLALYAEHVGALLASVQVAEQLRQAMHTRSQIGEAIGVMMAREHLTPSEALEMLVTTSKDLNLKLREVAALVVGDSGWAGHPAAEEERPTDR